MKRNKLLILIGVVILVIFFAVQSRKSASVKVGWSSSNYSNKWSSKFHYLDGDVVGSFRAKTDTTRLIYSSKLGEGKIEFQLYNSADSLLRSFSSESSSDTIIGIFEKGQQYTIIGDAQEAKGQFNFKME